MSLMAYNCLLSFLLFTLSLSITAAKRVYIVHMDPYSKPETFPTHHHWYVSTLQSITSSSVDDSLVYTYDHVLHGFAAYIDPEEAESLKEYDSVINVYENKFYSVLTTRTPEFLGLNSNFANAGLLGGYKNFGEIDQASHGIVIGVLDTGIWPESKSFHDSGMPNIPKKWRVVCESAPDFSPKLCNKKLISARSFLKASFKEVNETNLYESPRDIDGHGTHVASTAAGSRVANVSLFGYASGTARGVATRARIASYRVCLNDTQCAEADILKGMNQAVSDGCHVLSLSLSGGGQYHEDPISIAGFHAVQKGVVVSTTAGNSGPEAFTVANTAPWLITTGAATLDRNFPAHVLLGNKIYFTGISLSSTRPIKKQARLVYLAGNKNSSMCLPGSLDPKLVRGKLVICDQGKTYDFEKGKLVKKAGGIGIIAVSRKESVKTIDIYSELFPNVVVGKEVGNAIKKYMKSDPQATASLSYGKTAYNVKPAPKIAIFSSRGPNGLIPQILKPDIVAPGVNILAAWPDSAPVFPVSVLHDPRRAKYNILSGTSMACPHVSGIIALLKVLHPDWSPSAIKSALMTTAYTLDNTNSPLIDEADGSLSTPLAHGAGHVNPQKALSPGLVYDISTTEYGMFLCLLNYNATILKGVFNITNCSKKFSDPGQLNYPSFSVVFEEGKGVEYTLELTNVDATGSTYAVHVTAPSSVTVTVKPTRLVFKKKGDKQRYTVTFVPKKGAKPDSEFASGSIVWSNPNHQIRSPIVFFWT